MKRGALALAACLVVDAGAAAGATLTLPADAGGPPGATIVVTLMVDDAAGMEGTDLVIAYDPAIATATAVSATSLSAGHTLVYNLSPPGVIRVALYGAQPLSGGGALLTISFSAGPTPGGRTALAFAHAEANEGGVGVAAVDGALCVEGTADEVAGLTAGRVPATTTAILAWNAHPYATAYNVYRAARPDLSDLGCLLAGVLGLSAADDGAVPPAGAAFFHLVTAITCSGESSPGRDSAGVERFLPSPCP